MPPLITVTGRTDTGKTTLVVKLVRELTKRGYRVATIKDSQKCPTFDVAGKDSARHVAAGSIATAIKTEQELAIIKPFKEEVSLDEIARMLGDEVDLVIAEGFKYADSPKIEVHRKGMNLLGDVEGLVAYATEEELDTDLPQFNINDYESIADFLEKNYIKPDTQNVKLIINNEPIFLKEYPAAFLENVVTNMVNALKGIPDIETIELSIKKLPGGNNGH
jgi:molybdopterin-guanine dinucleotide biosynthesis protein B